MRPSQAASRSILCFAGLLAACASAPPRAVSAPASTVTLAPPAAADPPPADPPPADPAPALDPRVEQLRLAAAEYQRAIELDPARPEAWFDLGALLNDACGDTASFARGRDYVARAATLGAADGRHAEIVARAHARLQRVGVCGPGMASGSGYCTPADEPPPLPPGVQVAPRVDCGPLLAGLPSPSAPR